MKTSARDASLTFDWPVQERFPWYLFGFVVASLAAHVGSFFIFQVVYPQRVTIPPLAPQITLLTPSSPENRALLNWITAEDPALVAGAVSETPVALLNVPYRASWLTPRTVPRTVAEPPATLQFPPAAAQLQIIRSAEPTEPSPAPALAPLKTRITFSNAIGSRALTRAPDLAGVAKNAALPDAARFLIGVTDRGEVRYVFLQKSSGDDTLDETAVDRLGRTSFAPATDPITWAEATIVWGDDAFSGGSK